MKKRYCCQMAVVVVILLFGVYHLLGAQCFSALQVSIMEDKVSEGEVITIKGSVSKKLRTEKGFDFYLKPENKKEFIYVSMSEKYTSEKVMIGQLVNVTGEVVVFDNAHNLGNFNQKLYYQKQNVYVKLQNAVVKIENKGISRGAFLKENVWEIQQYLVDKMISYVGEMYGGILSAIVLGEDAFVDADLKEIFQKSGIGHLLAISGLHISFLGAGCYHLMRKMRFSIVFSSVSSGGVLVFYIFMIGWRTSAIRAGVMFLLQMGANITGREYDGKTALAVAALVVLAKEPVLLFDAGFLLSFGAVLGIYAVAPAWKLKPPLAIQCMLFPVQLYYYYEVCIYSMFWNFLAIPLSVIILGSGILGVLISQIPFVPELFTKGIFSIGKMVLWFYEEGSQFVLGLPFSRWVIGRPSFAWMVTYYMILFLCILMKKRKWPMIAASIFLIVGTKWTSNQLQIAMLDVGQGDCFFIQGPESGTYLIDGGSSSISQVGKYRIEPYLKCQGIGTLDYVWVTHGDLDHMNGIIELLQRKKVGVEIKTLILPDKNYWNDNIDELVHVAEKAGTNIHIMAQGQRLEEGEMQIRCLWPQAKEEGMDENQASIVLSLSYGTFDMLFTGDLEKEAEEKVAEYIETGQKKLLLPDKYEVLKVGHHGSKSGTGEDLLKVVQPDIALISAGENNRYGHPHAETVERLESAGSEMITTIEYGQVVIAVAGDKVRIESIKRKDE